MPARGATADRGSRSGPPRDRASRPAQSPTESGPPAAPAAFGLTLRSANRAGRPPTIVWTMAAFERVQVLRGQGLSYSAVARVLTQETRISISKNQVLQAFRRCKLEDPHPEAGVSPIKRKPAVTERRPDQQCRRGSRAEEILRPAVWRGCGDWRPLVCQWIAGDPRVCAETCGAPVKAGSSYCAKHHARAYQAGTCQVKAGESLGALPSGQEAQRREPWRAG